MIRAAAGLVAVATCLAAGWFATLLIVSAPGGSLPRTVLLAATTGAGLLSAVLGITALTRARPPLPQLAALVATGLVLALLIALSGPRLDGAL